MTAATAAALHGLDKDETRRKMGALLARIDSLAQVGHASVLTSLHSSTQSAQAGRIRKGASDGMGGWSSFDMHGYVRV